jgi:phage terminase small subunit
MAQRKLTPLQKRFKNNILKGMNQTDAYLAAGYKCTRSAARRNAARLMMTNADIRNGIKEAQKKAADKAELTHERILREEMCLAFFNPQRLVDKKGKLIDLQKLPEDVARAIVGLEVITQPKDKLKFKYKFSDKGKSLDRLERIKGMFAPEKHEIAGKDGNAIDLTTIVLRVTEKNESGASN